MVKVEFNQESALHAFEEISALLPRHQQELDIFTDLNVCPDLKAYVDADEQGHLALFTARTEHSELVGYAVFSVRESAQFIQITAKQSLIYMAPEYRGHYGLEFVKWCDQQLKTLGVDVVYHGVSLSRDFGVLLKRIGYTHVENIFERRLNHGATS